jgi:hypothetical protein
MPGNQISKLKGGMMNRILKMVLLVVFAVALFGAYRYGAAQETGSVEGRTATYAQTFDSEISVTEQVATQHVIQGTYNNNSTEYLSIPAETYTPIDAPLTIVCGGTTGTCTVEADLWIATGAGENARNEFEICLYVDKKPSQFCNSSVGETDTSGRFIEASTSQSFTGLAVGNHTVQTYFYSGQGAYVGYYNFNYRVYKP